MPTADSLEEFATSAVAYVRVSTDHQRFSADRQQTVISEYATAHRYKVLRSYIDLGKSGLSLKGRHGLRNLLADALRPDHDFSAILVYDISRWGRFQDPDQAAYYEFLCRQAGVAVHYCAEPFENDFSPMTGIWKGLKRVMAHEYSRELSERVARAKLQQARLGFKQGGPLIYGFRRQLCDEHGNPRVVLKLGQAKAIRSDRIRFIGGPDEELEIVRIIFDLYVRREFSVERTARYLRDHGVPGKDGRPWTSGMVRSVLGSELCIGRYIYNRTTAPFQTRRRKNPKNLWTQASTKMESIVPEALFAEAQTCLAERKSVKLDSEKLLDDLRALFKEKGRLSMTLIDEAPCMAARATYKSHFGTITEAYRRIGYVEPFCTDGWKRAWSREELRRDLVELYHTHGYLTGELINKAPNLPSHQAVRKRIGSMGQIHEFIGIKPLSHGETLRAANARFKVLRGYSVQAYPRKKHFSQEFMIERLKALLDKEGYLSAPLIKADPTLPSVTTIIERFGSVIAAYNAAGWSVDHSAITTFQLTRRYAARNVQ
jgi:DNA invertase Pin-like site-specific DNA recombinase